MHNKAQCFGMSYSSFALLSKREKLRFQGCLSTDGDGASGGHVSSVVQVMNIANEWLPASKTLTATNKDLYDFINEETSDGALPEPE